MRGPTIKASHFFNGAAVLVGKHLLEMRVRSCGSGLFSHRGGEKRWEGERGSGEKERKRKKEIERKREKEIERKGQKSRDIESKKDRRAGRGEENEACQALPLKTKDESPALAYTAAAAHVHLMRYRTIHQCTATTRWRESHRL